MAQIYSALKIFRYSERLDAIRTGAATAPVHVRIKPINACNHRCWFCAYRAENLELGSEMKLKDRIGREKMIEIIEDLIDMKVQAVTFSGGGEPLIYPHIVESVQSSASPNQRTNKSVKSFQ